MKKVLTLLTLAFFLGLTQTASAQTKSEGDITICSDKVVFDKDPQFTCKQLKYNDKTKVMTLTDNVSLKTDKFEFADAGKVVYDEKTKKLIIYDCKGFTIDGKVVVNDNASKVKTVEYTLGDDTVYLL
jgi:lipopolysaccharide export system protein LptA